MTPVAMGYVPGGWFQMGGTLSSRETPVHAVHLDGFFMDTYEVTNSEYAEFLNSCGHGYEERVLWLDLTSSYCLVEWDGAHFRARPGFERYPAVMVTWCGARAYARWSGKRLPTEAEWEKAALGGVDGRVYPWGDHPPMDQCNWRDYTGAYADLRPDFYHGRGPLPVGLFPPNEYGLHDLGGNVWEWCADWYDPDAYSAAPPIDPRGPATGIRRVLRGGSWSFDPINLRAAHRAYADPTRGYPYDGFRCAADSAAGSSGLESETRRERPR